MRGSTESRWLWQLEWSLTTVGGPDRPLTADQRVVSGASHGRAVGGNAAGAVLDSSLGEESNGLPRTECLTGSLTVAGHP